MPLTRRGLLASSLAIPAATLLVAGCDSSSAKKTSGNKKLDKVTFITGFQKAPREGCPWIGQQQGLWADQGLDVTIQPGAPATSVKSIEAGKADICDADYVSVMKALLNPAAPSKNVRIVAVMQSHSMTALISKASSNITTASDLEGKTIGVSAGAASYTLFPTFAKLAGIDAKKVKWNQVQNPATLPSALAAGQVDAIAGYVVDTPSVSATCKGAKLNTVLYSTYMNDLYGTVFVARKDLSDDIVKRAALAAFNSVRWSVDNPTKAATLLKRAVPEDGKLDITEGVLKLMKPYVPSHGGFDMTHSEKALSLLESAGVIKNPGSPDQYIDTAVMPKGTS